MARRRKVRRLNLLSVSHLEAHHRLFISSGITILVFIFLRSRIELPLLIMTTWITYASSLLLMVWITILTTHPKKIRYIAKLQDSSRSLIFLFVIFAACASILAVVILMRTIHDLSREEIITHIVISFTSVLFSWFLVHTIFALRYAHLYYTNQSNVLNKEPLRGLNFPSDEEPDYLDFAYFSFVIGMTCQVSDVLITGKPIRRLALVHGLLTFGFNTIIVALTINVISGLLAH